MLLLLLACSYLVDTNDCSLTSSCELYRPQGLLCGLTHDGWATTADPENLYGSLCTLDGEVFDAATGRERCPDGLEPIARVPDSESGGGLRSCGFAGNAARSSARAADVPDGLACGLNTVGDLTATQNTCGGFDPTEGECPPGFELRFARDLVTNCLVDEDAEDTDCSSGPDPGGVDTATPVGGCPGGEPPNPEAHLTVWCEAVDGCSGPDCPLDFGGVCGLIPVGASRLNGFLYETLEQEIRCQGDALWAAYEEALARDVALGDEPTRSCLGEELEYDECPAGLALVCVAECTGSGTAGPDGEVDACGNQFTPDDELGGLCWCTTPEAAALAPFEP